MSVKTSQAVADFNRMDLTKFLIIIELKTNFG